MWVCAFSRNLCKTGSFAQKVYFCAKHYIFKQLTKIDNFSTVLIYIYIKPLLWLCYFEFVTFTYKTYKLKIDTKFLKSQSLCGVKLWDFEYKLLWNTYNFNKNLCLLRYKQPRVIKFLYSLNFELSQCLGLCFTPQELC